MEQSGILATFYNPRTHEPSGRLSISLSNFFQINFVLYYKQKELAACDYTIIFGPEVIKVEYTSVNVISFISACWLKQRL